MDIFSTTKVDDEYWSEPLNMGTPFNSPKDDFGFILNVLGTEGYLSSARKGGKGLDDIYSFKLQPGSLVKPKVVRLTTSLCVYDEETKERLSDVSVSVIEGTRDESGFKLNDIYTYNVNPSQERESFLLLLKKNSADTIAGYTGITQLTDHVGEITYEMRPDKEYIIFASKVGYRPGKKLYTTEGMYEPTDLSLCIPLAKELGVSLKGIVTNLSQGNRIPNAKVKLLNHTTNEERNSESNLLGEFSFPNLQCDCDYTLTASKDGFGQNAKSVKLRGKECPEGETLHYNLPLLSVNEQPDLIVTSNGSSTTKMGVGTVIELENIYYDFDDYRIREGAAKTLDQIVALLRLYPGMSIELSAHTDSRGGWKYNRQLSKNRAKYARKYIRSKGIAARRLKSSGWGESKLRNNCDDGVYCSEEKHQYNRRTEIKVIQFDRPDINIKYLNNLPETIDAYVPKNETYDRGFK